MMRAGAGLLFALALLGGAVWAVVSALGWRQEVAMFPVFAGAVTLVLLAVETFREGRAIVRAEKEVIRRSESESHGKRSWAAPLWFFAFVGVVLLVGIPVGLPVMLLLMARFAFGETWVVSAGLAVAVGVLALLVFDVLFGVIWPRPLLMDWIRPL